MKWNPNLYKDKHSFVTHYGESLVEILAPKEKERILDLGCGTGELSYQIYKLCSEVIGIDKSEEMVNKAKADFPEIKFEKGDAEDFSFEKKFDAIFSNATLHWVTDYESAIKCMYNNLKEEGRIVLEFGGKGNVEIITDALRTQLAEQGYHEQSSINPWYFPSIGDYSSALEKMGFKVSLAQHYSRPTKLLDSKNGIVDWIRMFGKMFFPKISEKEMGKISLLAQESLKSKLYKNGSWYADYKRIRIQAFK